MEIEIRRAEAECLVDLLEGVPPEEILKSAPSLYWREDLSKRIRKHFGMSEAIKRSTPKP